MMRDGGMNPRLLLVEDDPVSQTYLADAARALPANVDTAGSIAEAVLLATRHRYDAWLIDANLPDGSGAALLARLRVLRPSGPPAMAHTASQLPEDLAALRESGFDAAVSKPLPIVEWQQAIRRCLDRAPSPMPAWDDERALHALNGSESAMASLRQLFVAELPKQYHAIRNALGRGDVDAAQGELHRMKASCGFVGATKLGQAVDDLYAAPSNAQACEQFDTVVAETLKTSPLRG